MCFSFGKQQAILPRVPSSIACTERPVDDPVQFHKNATVSQAVRLELCVGFKSWGVFNGRRLDCVAGARVSGSPTRTTSPPGHKNVGFSRQGLFEGVQQGNIFICRSDNNSADPATRLNHVEHPPYRRRMVCDPHIEGVGGHVSEADVTLRVLREQFLRWRSWRSSKLLQTVILFLSNACAQTAGFRVASANDAFGSNCVQRSFQIRDQGLDARNHERNVQPCCKPSGLGRMAALSKPHGGARGIFVGDIVRRLVARSMAKQIGKKLGATTAPFQNVKSTKTSTDVDLEATVTFDGVGRMIWSPATPCQSAC